MSKSTKSITNKSKSTSRKKEDSVEKENVENLVYRCPEGDYKSTNFLSVRAHCQRKHRYKVELVDGVIRKIEPTREGIKPEREPIREKTLPTPLTTLPKTPRAVEKLAGMTLEELAEINPNVRMTLEQAAELQAENVRLAEAVKNVRLRSQIQNYDYIRRPRYEDEDDLVALRKSRLYEEEIKKLQAERQMLERPSQPQSNAEITVLRSSLDDLRNRLEKSEEDNKELRRRRQQRTTQKAGGN
ncbi:MAG: hypothetical protein QMD13_08000 [Candidatus Bathyarchaeia archaeon]|nr:hypothetical protein [Candidatus Bathyarchaeia archaeon]